MAKRTEKKGWAIAIVVFMVLAMVLFAAGGVLSALSNQSSPTQNPEQGAPQPTEIIHYVPNAATTTIVEHGSCWTNSIAAPYRRDAWRCTVGNEIHDPCFETPNKKGLLCDVNPMDKGAASTFMLLLSKPLPASGVMPSSTPSNWAWAVALADGTYCTPFTGTRPFAASGEMAYYSCNSQDPTEEFIFGELNDSSTVWTAVVGSLSRSSSTYPPAAQSLRNIPVKTVWQ